MSDKKLMDEQEDTLRAYQRLFESSDGQKVLNDLLNSCFFTKTTYSENPQEFAFNEGQRAVMLRILATLKTNIGTYKRQVEDYLKQQGDDPWGFS